MFLQVKGSFVPEQHTDYIFFITNTFKLLLAALAIIIVLLFFWKKRRLKK